MERDKTRESFTAGTERDFNSHAHVERDPRSAVEAGAVSDISTHTLTWSVTLIMAKIKKNLNISTHTLTWSVTGSRPSQRTARQFQLTRSRGA